MNGNNILFVNHKESQCGVYEFGENIFNAIKSSKKYSFIKAECNDIIDLKKAIAKEHPIAIIYNYMPATMPWVANSIFRNKILKNNIGDIPVLQIGIIHSVLQEIADSAKQGSEYEKNDPEWANRLFDFYIAPDPTLLLKNPYVFKHGRPIPTYTNKFPIPEKLTIGSFGFAKKGYEDLINLVQSQFDEAEIRINIPFARFGDTDGKEAKSIADNCRQLLKKPGVTLSISHDYLDKNALMDFLAQNTINIFLRDKGGRGISSVIDYALAVDRPIAISDSQMFRHISDSKPSIRVEESSLKEIIDNGTAPLKRYTKEWTSETLCWEYERILDAAIPRVNTLRTSKKRKLKHRIKVLLSLFGYKIGNESNSNNWLSTTDYLYEDDYQTINKNATYSPIAIEGVRNYNGILDNKARELYKPTVEHLFGLVPKTMAKKIPEANVQQAFVFDTVYRHLKHYKNPKILSVGSFEDTASMGLIKMGIAVDEVDPMFNYFLQDFFTKPGTVKGSYDIIFSTSVIEHDPDDKSFVECVSKLLAPNGMFVMTCDYKDGWQPGDLKPGVCARLYTKSDLESRLPSYMEQCKLIDEPHWDCPNPDFVLGGVYTYAFASFVAKKGM
jgi:SAM-dependent methyltransferase